MSEEQQQLLTCFRCEKALEAAGEHLTHQPWGATTFSSEGQYGSTVFDPMGAELVNVIMVHLCDECLIRHQHLVTAWQRSTTCDEAVPVPWQAPHATVEEYQQEQTSYN